MRTPGFDVLAVHSVIADQRIGHGDDLAFVGWVSQNLLIAGHGGVETDLATGGGASAKSLAVINGAVFESEDRFHQCWNGMTPPAVKREAKRERVP